MSFSEFQIFGTHKDYFKSMFSDVVEDDNVKYYDFQFTERRCFWRFLCCLLGKTWFPFKKSKLLSKVAFKGFSKHIKVKDSSCVCFLFFGHCYSFLNFNCFDQLRKKYPNCKIVYYFEDSIAYFKNTFPALDLQKLKSECDLVLSYNRSDAVKNSLFFYPLFYPMDKKNANSDFKYFAFFAGANKNRLGKLYDTYERLNKLNEKCLFFINGVKESDKRVLEGIVYNNVISYKQILDYSSQSECLLELVTEGLEGFTMRILEAMSFDKVLITDSVFLKEVFPKTAPILYLNEDLSEQMQAIKTRSISWGDKKYTCKNFFKILSSFDYEHEVTYGGNEMSLFERL